MSDNAAYWWVNHGQSFTLELDGGYIWSPIHNANGAKNQTYLNMQEVRSGDYIISYAKKAIRAIGIATSCCDVQNDPHPKQSDPDATREPILGWKVAVNWIKLDNPVEVVRYIDHIRGFLPDKYSPLQHTGKGNQCFYLMKAPYNLYHSVFEIIKQQNNSIDTNITTQTKLIEKGKINCEMTETEKQLLISARIGQSLFRENVLNNQKKCRVTGVGDKHLLIASHIKPWRQCTDMERVDPDNGLALSPHIDKLFDKGWISFEDNGDMLISKRVESALDMWKIDKTKNVGCFSKRQAAYLAYHRKNIFMSNG